MLRRESLSAMSSRMRRLHALTAALLASLCAGCGTAPVVEPMPSTPLPSIALSHFAAPVAAPFEPLDDSVRTLMARAQVPGLALALIRHGRVVYTQAYGVAGPATDGQPAPRLRTDSLMHGASLTKAAFAYLVMRWVDRGRLDLDQPIAELLPQPLPALPGYQDLASDPRWRQLSMRMLLSHRSGLPNFRSLTADGRLGFVYAPGERYVYSGEGIQIAQQVLEAVSGQPLSRLMQAEVFDRFGMRDSQLVWQDSMAGRLVTGFDTQGRPTPERRPRHARAASSMITTVADVAAFLAGVLRGDGLSAGALHEMLGPQIAIVSPRQFPSQAPGKTRVNEAIGLSAGLGWVVYRSPMGPAFFKEGNDPGTQNVAIGFSGTGDGLVLLANSSRGDRMFHPLLELLFGPSCLPWFWMGYVPYDQPAARERSARAPAADPACRRALADRPDDPRPVTTR
jgi:CubicO group peptidase (beta-lactamase class C family)